MPANSFTAIHPLEVRMPLRPLCASARDNKDVPLPPYFRLPTNSI
jgi:hypothetical protein